MFILILLLPSLCQSQTADLVFVNGKLWTVDAKRPTGEGVAVLGDKILAVGTTAEMKKYVGSATKVIDLKGKRMLPGFIDDHTHFMTGGFQLQSVDLRFTKSEREFAAVIGERSAKRPGKWITGGDWDHDNWPGGNLPTKELVDALTPQTPVFVNRYDGHMALANSYVLKLAGIDKNTPDPPGGTIVRDKNTGEATGVLKDAAMNLVYRHVPDPSMEEMMEAARLALAEARKYGVTSIQDVSSAADVRVYQILRDRGDLTARFHCRLPLSQWEHLAALGIRVPFGDCWVRVGSMKEFVDGSLGSSTALFYEPYTSDPGTKGLAMDVVGDGSLARWGKAADRAGLQLSIHAIGDSGNSVALDLFENIA